MTTSINPIFLRGASRLLFLGYYLMLDAIFPCAVPTILYSQQFIGHFLWQGRTLTTKLLF